MFVTEAPPKDAAVTSLPGNPVGLTLDTAADTMSQDSNDIQKTVPSVTSQSLPEVIGNILNVGFTSEETVEVTTEVSHPVTHLVDQEIGTSPGTAEQQEVELVESDQILHTVTEMLNTMHVVSLEDEEPPREEGQEVLTEAAVVVLPNPTVSPAAEAFTLMEYDDLLPQVTPVFTEGVGIEEAPGTTSTSFFRPKLEEILDNSLDTSPDVPLTITLTERPIEDVPESVVEAVALTHETPISSGSKSEVDKANLDDPSEAVVEVHQDKIFSTETTPTVFLMIEPEDKTEVTINEIPEQESDLDVTSQASILMSTREMVAEVRETAVITVEETRDEEAVQEIPTIWTTITEETIKDHVLVSTAKSEDLMELEAQHEGTVISTEDKMSEGETEAGTEKETVQTEEPTIGPTGTDVSAEEQVEALEKKFTTEEPVKGQAEAEDSIVEAMGGSVEGGYTFKTPLKPKEQDGHEQIEELEPSEDPIHESEPVDEAEPPGTDAKKPEIVEKTQKETEPAEDTTAETTAHDVEIELEAVEREEHSAELTTELTFLERNTETSPEPTDKSSEEADVKEPRTEPTGDPAEEPKTTGEPTQKINLPSDITEAEPTTKPSKETEPDPEMEIPETVIEGKLTEPTTQPEQFPEPKKETDIVIRPEIQPKDKQELTEQNPNPEGSVKPAQEINHEPTTTQPLEMKPAKEIKTTDKPVTMRPPEPTPEPVHVPQLTTELSQQTDPSISQENQESTRILAGEGLLGEPAQEPEPTQKSIQETKQITESTQGTQQTIKPTEDQRHQPTTSPEQTDFSTETTRESKTSEEPTPEAEAAEEQPGAFEEPTQGPLPTEKTSQEVETIRESTQEAKLTINPAQELGHTEEPTQTEQTETTEEPLNKTKLEQESQITTKQPSLVPEPRTESTNIKNTFEEGVEEPQLKGQEPKPTGESMKELELEPPLEPSKDPNLHEEPSLEVENPIDLVMETEFPKETEKTAEPAKETDLMEQPKRKSEPTRQPKPGQPDEPAGNKEPTEGFIETGPSLRPDDDEADLHSTEEPFKEGADKTSETSDEVTKKKEGTKDVSESLVLQTPEKEITPVVGPEDSKDLLGTTGQDGSPHGSEDHVPRETSSHEVGPAITVTKNVPEGEDPSQTSPEVLTKALPGTQSEEEPLKTEERPIGEKNVTLAVLPAANDGDKVMLQTNLEFGTDEGGGTTQRTLTVEEVTQGSSAKYAVETNNGNFLDLAVPPYVDKDLLLGNNGFVGELEEDNSVSR